MGIHTSPMSLFRFRYQECAVYVSIDNSKWSFFIYLRVLPHRRSEERVLHFRIHNQSQKMAKDSVKDCDFVSRWDRPGFICFKHLIIRGNTKEVRIAFLLPGSMVMLSY